MLAPHACRKSALEALARRRVQAGRHALGCYNLILYGGYSSVAERRTVAPDVVGSTPTSRPIAAAPNREIVTRQQSSNPAAASADAASPAPAANISSAVTSSGDSIFVGCSGWAYPQWKPEFYPPKTPAKKFLEHYAGRLNSVEVNYTFRHLPSPSTIVSWLAQVSEGFRFSFKAPQRITHLKRLKDCAEPLSLFYSALAPVIAAGRMGAILFQLPPNFKMDLERLTAFLAEASPAGAAGPRAAFEFRHPSWFTEAVYERLRLHNAALCVAESDELETPEVATASFACYRLRKSDYSAEELRQVERRLRQSAERGEVFAYFKHEETPAGALNAEALLKRLRAG